MNANVRIMTIRLIEKINNIPSLINFDAKDEIDVARGKDPYYFEVILTFPALWWLGFAGLLVLGAVILWKFPVWKIGKLNAVFHCKFTECTVE